MVLVCGLVLGAFVLGHQVPQEAVQPPAAAVPADPAPHPSEKWAAARHPSQAYQAQPAAAAGCPAGFVDQGGVCVGQDSAAYQDDLQRRRDIEDLADELADELRDD